MDEDYRYRYPAYSGNVSKVMGGIHLLCSVIVICASIAGIGLSTRQRDVTVTSASIVGIIFGVIFCITGIFCIVAGRTKKKNFVIVNMLFSILSCIAGFIMAAVGAYLVFVVTALCVGLNRTSKNCSSRIGLLALILIVPLLEAVAALVSSILCCKVACCGVSAHPGRVISMQQGGVTQPTYGQYGGQPQKPYPTQQGMSPPYSEAQPGQAPEKVP